MAEQIIPQYILDSLPTQFGQTTITQANPNPSRANQGLTRVVDVIAPPANAIAITAPVFGMGGPREQPTGEYYIPLDIPNYPQTDAGGGQVPPLVAKYDASGKLQTITALQRYLGDAQNNISVQPEYNLSGELISTNPLNNAEGEGGGFGDFLSSFAKDFGPMILAGLGANYLAGSGLLSGGAAGAAGAASSGTGLTLGGGGLGLSAGGSGLGITAGSAGASSIGAGIGSTLAGITTGIGTGALEGLGSGASSFGPVDYSLGSGSALPSSGTGIDQLMGSPGGPGGITQLPSTGTGLTANTGTGLNLVADTGGGLGLNATTGTGLDLAATTGGGLGLTAGSAGSNIIGAGLGDTLAAINTGINTGLSTGVDYGLTTGGGTGGSTGITTGGMSPVVPSVPDFSSLGDVGSTILKFAKDNPSIAGALLGAVTSAIGAKDAPTSATTTSNIDPQIKAEYLANLERAKTTAAGLEARAFQDFTPDYQLASQQIKNIGLGGIGQQTTNKAAELALLEAGFTPQQIQAANAGSASQASATGYTAAQMAAAQANRANVANVASGAGSQYMSAYQNPYEQQVVQGALGDIERSRLMQEQANRDQATRAKAFGGSRQGIVSGMTNEAALRQAANTAAQLRSAGFTQAAQLGQTDAARALQAQLANQGIDITLEQANAQLSQQGLLSNQAATNQALQFGAGATNQANLSNAAALNQMSQFNAQMQQQAALANQSAFAQGAGIRQGAIGQLGQLGAQQQNLGLTGANAVMEDQIRQQALQQARLDAARNLSLERLSITSGALGLQPANLGGTTSQPLYNNTAGSLLSGGLTGAYIGSLLGK